MQHCTKSEQKHIFTKRTDIFEDTLFSLKLLKVSKPKRLKSVSETSAIRFLKNGVYKQALLNQKLKWHYYLNKNNQKMNKEYESGLDLNSEYKK